MQLSSVLDAEVRFIHFMKETSITVELGQKILLIRRYIIALKFREPGNLSRN